MAHVKKSDQASDYFKAGNVKDALRLAKSFKMGLSKDEKRQLERGYECFVRPDFYKSLGKDPDQEIAKATKIFKTKLVK